MAPRSTPRRAFASLCVAAVAAVAMIVAPSSPDRAEASSASDAVAVVFEGGGFGHGRGMSQWGALGYAVDYGWSFDQILGHYFGNTALGPLTDADFVGVSPGRMSVELTAMRVTRNSSNYPGATVVVSSTGQAQWVADPEQRVFGALKAREVPGRERVYEIFGRAATSCQASGSLAIPEGPLSKGDEGDEVRVVQQFLTELGFAPGGIDGDYGNLTTAAVIRFQDAARAAGRYDDVSDGVWGPLSAAAARIYIDESRSGWELLGEATGEVGAMIAGFTTPGSEDSATPRSEVLTVCTPQGPVQYRGVIGVANGTDGENVTVNDVALEDYVRGVVSKEMSDAWGDAGGGAGLQALRAQAVSARSYAVAQGLASSSGRRFSYAKTCDSMSCQVYGGASAEGPNGTIAVADTAGLVLRRDGRVMSTEYSASSGGVTAGGAYPSVEDLGDAYIDNPRHTWTRMVSPSAILGRCSGHGGSLVGITTETDPSLLASGFTGRYAERTRVTGPSGSCTIRNESLRTGLGLPSGAFSVRLITRGPALDADFAFIADSVGEGLVRVTGALPRLVDGLFRDTTYDAVANRRTVAPGATPLDGLGVARALEGSPAVVVVGLGYNDGARFSAAMVDAVMSELVDMGVQRVGWIGLSERNEFYAPANRVLRDATSRWSQLSVLDWNAVSSAEEHRPFFTDYGRRYDGVHLSTTGSVEMALWLRTEIERLATGARAVAPDPNRSTTTTTRAPTTTTTTIPLTPIKVTPKRLLRVPVSGLSTAGGLASTSLPSGTRAVAVNVTAVDPDAAGYLTVWPCASERPETSVLNVTARSVIPNSLLAPVDANGEVCIYSSVATHVLVDLAGGLGFQVEPLETPVRKVDTRLGIGAPVGEATRARLRVSKTAQAAAVTVTVVEPRQAGFVTLWPCDQPRPETSVLNYARGQTVANSVVVPVDAERRLCVYASSPTHVLVDLEGLVRSGYRAVGPVRLVDTRHGIGAPSGRSQSWTVTTARYVEGAEAVAVTLTTVNPTAAGYLTVWPCDRARPDTSVVNFAAGQTVANSMVVPVADDGTICVASSEPTDLIVDLAGGVMDGFTAVGPTRIVDTRYMVGPRPGT